ncbi:MAG: DUF4352 domain-containing protein [Lachnospiraceae bacterium]|nr:DUF4352 domain-containing protein [Lachnospiraceae bacterium]
MRKWLAICISVCILMLTGCTGDNNLSQREQNVVADYTAQIVLRHSKGYEYKLVDVSGNPFIREEIDETSLSKDEDKEEEQEQEKEEQEKEQQDNETEGDSNTQDSEEETKEEVSIGSALGFNEKIKVEVMKTKVVDDLSKGAYYLEAEKGKKLVKVDFKITNKGDKKAKVLYNNSNCKLYIEAKEYSPLQTAIDNDLNFLSASIEKNKSITASLVYSVDEKDAKLDKKIEITTKDIQTTVDLD